METSTGQKKNLYERTVAFSLELHGIGNSRKADINQVEVEASKEKLRLSKKILECEEMEEIRGLDLKLRSYIRARSVPYPLKAGIYLIPVDLVEEVDAQVERTRPVRDALASRLSGRVGGLKNLDRSSLGVLFREEDYPTEQKILEAFRLETRYITLGVPGNLGTISRDIWQREKDRIGKELESAAEEIKQVQRLALQELIDGLMDKLTPDADGTRKRIKQGGPLDKIIEFLGRYGKLNVTDDAELSSVVDQAKALLNGCDAETLRNGFASKIREGMAEIRKAIEPLITKNPTRKFRT